MMFLALRSGEVCALRREDIDMKNRIVTINGSLKHHDNEWKRGATKGKKVLTLPLPGFLIPALSGFLKAHPDEPPFRYRGNPLSPHTLYHRIAALKRKHDLKNIHPHTLRHTCATLLLDKGVPLETIQRILGHADSRMTQHYAHVTEELRQLRLEQQRESLELLSDYFEGKIG